MASGGPSCGLRPPRGLWATVHCASCTNPRPPDPCSAPGLCDCGGRGTGARSWGSSTSTLEPQAGAPEAEPRHGHTLWGQVALLNAPAAGLSGLTSLGPGAGGDHEALGEDADAAVTVTLQPLLVHCGAGEGEGRVSSSVCSRKPVCRGPQQVAEGAARCPTFTQDVHDVPRLQVQVLRPLGRVAVPGHHLVEDGPATRTLQQRGRCGPAGHQPGPGAPRTASPPPHGPAV